MVVCTFAVCILLAGCGGSPGGNARQLQGFNALFSAVAGVRLPGAATGRASPVRSSRRSPRRSANPFGEGGSLGLLHQPKHCAYAHAPEARPVENGRRRRPERPKAPNTSPPARVWRLAAPESTHMTHASQCRWGTAAWTALPRAPSARHPSPAHSSTARTLIVATWWPTRSTVRALLAAGCKARAAHWSRFQHQQMAPSTDQSNGTATENALAAPAERLAHEKPRHHGPAGSAAPPRAGLHQCAECSRHGDHGACGHDDGCGCDDDAAD